MPPRLFCVAARRAGFRARVVRRALHRIPGEVLPAVIVDKAGKARIFLRRNGGRAVILDPVTRVEEAVEEKTLAEGYAGYAIYARPDPAEEDGEAGPLSRHWFWGTMMENGWLYAN